MAARLFGLELRTPLVSARLGWLVRCLVALFVVGVGMALGGRTALAATLLVTTTADAGAGSLRDAIAAAGSGDTIVFMIPATQPGCAGGSCSIRLTNGELRIDKDLKIVGPGPGRLR